MSDMCCEITIQPVKTFTTSHVLPINCICTYKKEFLITSDNKNSVKFWGLVPYFKEYYISEL